jgi:hypothetical protein
MKSQKGMSYITLIIILIILAFVIAIAIHFTKVMIENKRFETYETDMLQIQGKVKILQQEAIMNDDDGKLQGRKLEKYAEIEEIKKLIDNQIVLTEGDDYGKYYIVDNYDLKNMKLENIQIDEGLFIVNYNTEEVIYSEGVQKGEKTYYKLSDMRNAEKEESTEETTQETSQEETSEEESTEETTEESTEE